MSTYINQQALPFNDQLTFDSKETMMCQPSSLLTSTLLDRVRIAPEHLLHKARKGALNQARSLMVNKLCTLNESCQQLQHDAENVIFAHEVHLLVMFRWCICEL